MNKIKTSSCKKAHAQFWKFLFRSFFVGFWAENLIQIQVGLPKIGSIYYWCKLKRGGGVEIKIQYSWILKICLCPTIFLLKINVSKERKKKAVSVKVTIWFLTKIEIFKHYRDQIIQFKWISHQISNFPS